MEQIDTKVKRWGNSFGVILPKRIVDKENITEGIEITISVHPKKSMTADDLRELAKKMGLTEKLKNVNTQEALREVDKAFWQE